MPLRRDFCVLLFFGALFFSILAAVLEDLPGAALYRQWQLSKSPRTTLLFSGSFLLWKQFHLP